MAKYTTAQTIFQGNGVPYYLGNSDIKRVAKVMIGKKKVKFHMVKGIVIDEACEGMEGKEIKVFYELKK